MRSLGSDLPLRRRHRHSESRKQLHRFDISTVRSYFKVTAIVDSGINPRRTCHRILDHYVRGQKCPSTTLELDLRSCDSTSVRDRVGELPLGFLPYSHDPTRNMVNLAKDFSCTVKRTEGSQGIDSSKYYVIRMGEQSELAIRTPIIQ